MLPSDEVYIAIKNINSPVPEWPYKQAVSVADKSGG